MGAQGQPAAAEAQMTRFLAWPSADRGDPVGHVGTVSLPRRAPSVVEFALAAPVSRRVSMSCRVRW